jgi:VWFA-related protein
VSEDTFEKIRASFPALAGAFSEFDEVAVYRFDKFVTKLLDFSADNITVEGALKRMEEAAPAERASIASGPFSAQGPVINGIPVIPGGPEPSGARAASPGAKLLHDAMFTAAAALSHRGADRRRIIVVVSDGQARGDDNSFDQVVDKLLDHGIQVYAIGTDQAFIARRFSVLDSYAKRTGGDACFLNSVDAMEKCYFRTTEAARNQYVLAYVSNNEARGPIKVFRELEVRSPRRDLEIRHRRGYYQYP